MLAARTTRSNKKICGNANVAFWRYGYWAEGWQVLNAINPTMVQGATLADFTPLSGFSVTVSGCAGH